MPSSLIAPSSFQCFRTKARIAQAPESTDIFPGLALVVGVLEVIAFLRVGRRDAQHRLGIVLLDPLAGQRAVGDEVFVL
jgi:hypothetical protein